VRPGVLVPGVVRMSTFGAEPVDTTPPCIITASGVTTYATVAELYDEVGLATGYYEVPDVGITYWDGVTFFPYLPLSAPVDLTQDVTIGYSVGVVNAVFAEPLSTTIDGSTGTSIDTGSSWSVV